MIYLTEDDPTALCTGSGPTPGATCRPGLSRSSSTSGGALRWAAVPDPSAATAPTKDQVPGARRFDGGEGADVIDGALVFSTKGDNRLWRLDPDLELEVLWDGATATDDVVIEDVDNVVVGPGGWPYVAEDGEGQHLVVVGVDGAMWPVAQVVDTPGSEITGPAFSPDGTRVYFSSQRSPGRTYEVSGPFVAD